VTVATLTQVREALATLIQNNIPELAAYPRMVDMPNTPCAIIEPTESDFSTVMQRGEDCWYLLIYILCSRNDSDAAQAELDEFVAGSGDKSIRQVVYDNYDLGLDNTQAFVTGMKGYGGSFEANRTPMVGAVLTVKVSTDGRVQPA
jgi:hypothetical protein